MARVTVEDCVELVPNRFELVMMAAQRAREIHGGQHIRVERDRDINTVVALREIAAEVVSLDDLRESLIQGHQRPPEVDEPEEEIVELMAGEAGYQGMALPESETFMDMSFDSLEEDEEEDEDSDVEGSDDLSASEEDDDAK